MAERRWKNRSAIGPREKVSDKKMTKGRRTKSSWIQGHGALSLRPTGSKLRNPVLSLSRWTARVTWVRGFSPREDTPIGWTRRRRERKGSRRERRRAGKAEEKRTRLDSWRQRRRPSETQLLVCLSTMELHRVESPICFHAFRVYGKRSVYAKTIAQRGCTLHRCTYEKVVRYNDRAC